MAEKVADGKLGFTVDPERVGALFDELSASSRLQRQHAASDIAYISRVNVSLLIPYSSVLISALECKEARTRWECLDALYHLIDVDSRACDKALQGAETALFDEDSGPLRLAAFRFLAKLGSTTENRSEKVWPLLDEALQCYHGDSEFQSMLGAVLDFADGKIAISVKESLAARVSFDAQNGKGVLQRKSSEILARLSS